MTAVRIHYEHNLFVHVLATPFSVARKEIKYTFYTKSKGCFDFQIGFLSNVLVSHKTRLIIPVCSKR